MKPEKLKALIYMTAVLGLSGCAAFDAEPYNIIHPISHITITVDPMLGMMPNQYGSHEQGQAVVNCDTCHITLREYPVCLAHEMRHCIEGQWHPPMVANDDDCYQDGQQQNTR